MHVRSTRRGLAMGVLVVASFMDLLDVTVVQVALPTIRSDLGASPTALEWVVSGYMLAFAVLLVTGGRIGDLIGRRTAFVTGVIGFTLASLAAALVGDAGALVVARLVQGAFAALMVPQVLATLQALYRPKERAPWIGVMGAVSGVAAVVAPVLGGWLVTADLGGTSWRAVFLLNVPVGVLVTICAFVWVPDTRSDRAPRLDLAGVALLSVGLAGLLYPLVEGRTLGWPAWLLLPAVAGLGLMVWFVRHETLRERRDGGALLPMRLFVDRGYSAGLVTQAAFQGAMNAFSVAFLLTLQAVLGFDALAAGLTLLPMSIGALVGTGVAVPFGTKVGKPLVSAGALLQAGAVAWTLAVVGSRGVHLSGWDVALPLGIAGFGLALEVIPLVDIALATIDVRDAGSASGAYSTFQQLGAALGVAIAGTVFFGIIGDDWAPGTVVHALEAAGGVAIGGYILSAAAGLLLPGRAAVTAHARTIAELASSDLDPREAAVEQ